MGEAWRGYSACLVYGLYGDKKSDGLLKSTGHPSRVQIPVTMVRTSGVVGKTIPDSYGCSGSEGAPLVGFWQVCLGFCAVPVSNIALSQGKSRLCLSW